LTASQEVASSILVSSTIRSPSRIPPENRSCPGVFMA
jgi:hypothetical protein